MALQWKRLPNGAFVPADHPGAATPGAVDTADPSTPEAQAAPAPPAPAGPAAPPTAAPSGPAAAAPTPAAPGPTTPQGAPLATNAVQISAPFHQTLHGILSQPQTVTADDPQIKNALNASRAEEERNFARSRGEAAERATAQGTNMSGGFDALIAGQRAGIGARQGQRAADLVQQQQLDRMSQIMSALSIGQGVMSDSDRNTLQRELATLDASLRREGMGLQASEGAAERALRQALQSESIGFNANEGSAERDLRRALADQSTGFNYAQLNQQGDQFGQNLSAQLAMNDAELEQRLLLALLAGGG